MRLTAKSEYGLLALIELAAHEGQGPVSARQIAQSQSIPIKFLEQLLVSLRQAGLLTARRGARGGFELGAPAVDITVLAVVEALEGPLKPSPCSGDAECVRSGTCAAAHVWERASHALTDVFRSTSIAALAADQAVLDASAHAQLSVRSEER